MDLSLTIQINDNVAMANKSSNLHLLLQHMFRETEVTRVLYMDGFLRQAGLHLHQAWHALACIQALDRDQPLPSASAFKVDLESIPDKLCKGKRETLWRESHASVFALGPRQEIEEQLETLEAWVSAPRKQHKLLAAHLRFQLRAAELVYLRLINKNRAKRLSKWLRGRTRILAGVAGLAIIALLAGGLHAVLKGGGLQAVLKGDKAASDHAPAPSSMPAPKTLKLSDLAQRKEEGTEYNAKGNYQVKGILKIKLEKVRHDGLVDISLDNNDTYLLKFINGDKELGAIEIPKRIMPGIRVERLAVPVAAVKTGYDLLELSCTGGDWATSVGHLILEEKAPPAPGDSGASQTKDSGKDSD